MAMLVLTVANIVLFLVGSDAMILFSASVPYFSTIFGTVFIEGLPLIGVALFGIALIVLLAYLLCWIFSKKNPVWMMVALGLFVLDTIMLAVVYILAGDATGVLDALFHVWILVYLVIGAVNGMKLKKANAFQPTETVTDTTAS